MHPELKWFLMCVAVVMLGAFIGQAHSDYQKNQCRMELAKANVAAEKILEICK